MKTFTKRIELAAGKVVSADATTVYLEDDEPVIVGKDVMTYLVPQPGQWLTVQGRIFGVVDNLDDWEELTSPKKAAKK